DLAAFVETLGPSVKLRSPISFRASFDGLDDVTALMRAVFEVLRDIEYFEDVGTSRTRALFYRARIGGQAVEGAILVRLDERASVETLRELGAEIVVGDLRDRDSLDRACAGVDDVFSTATSIIREGEISAVDGSGQLNLVDAAHDAGVTRFVYVSFEELGTGR